jgi:PST family polysaccharide transporter
MMLNADYLVVGRVLGTISLGYYVMAFNLSSWPVNMFSTAAESVVLPGFARLQDDRGALRHAFLRWLVILLVVAVPVSVVLSLCAGPLINVLYGKQWSPAATALAFLAALGLARVAFHFITDLLMATGRGRHSFRLQAVWLVVVVPSLAVGAHLGGIRGVGIAHLAVALVVMLPLFLSSLSWLGIGHRELGAALRRPAAAGLVAAALALAALRAPVPDAPWRQLALLVIAGSAALAGYLVVIAPLVRSLVRSRDGPTAVTGDVATQAAT